MIQFIKSTGPTATTKLGIPVYTILLVFALACAPTIATIPQPTQTAAQSAPTTTPIASAEAEQESGAVFYPNAVTQTCARVTAYVLHMRETPDGTVIHWLYQDQIVTVWDTSGEWWKIDAYGITGYAYSAYLERTDCQ